MEKKKFVQEIKIKLTSLSQPQLFNISNQILAFVKNLPQDHDDEDKYVNVDFYVKNDPVDKKEVGK